MYQIEFSDRSLKRLHKIPSQWQARILNGVESLRADPFTGKKLQGRFNGMYSLRIWPYRVIYIIKKKEVIISVIDIGQRKDIYG